MEYRMRLNQHSFKNQPMLQDVWALSSLHSCEYLNSSK